jgi:hypothetical protein
VSASLPPSGLVADDAWPKSDAAKSRVSPEEDLIQSSIAREGSAEESEPDEREVGGELLLDELEASLGVEDVVDIIQ